jgi:uncharacterized protein YcnI
MKKSLAIISALTIFGLTMTNTVFAHVSISPKETTAGSQAFTFHVPNEQEEPTVSVKIEIPDGVEVTGIMALPGWTHTEKHEAVMEKPQGFRIVRQVFADHAAEETGRITEITWTGGKIGPGEYAEFSLTAKYDGEPKELLWKAYQTYADGDTVPWDASDEKHPAPKVTVIKDTQLAMMQTTLGEMKATQEKANAGQSQWLTIGAFLLSVTALGVGLKGKGKAENK